MERGTSSDWIHADHPLVYSSTHCTLGAILHNPIKVQNRPSFRMQEENGTWRVPTWSQRKHVNFMWTAPKFSIEPGPLNPYQEKMFLGARWVERGCSRWPILSIIQRVIRRSPGNKLMEELKVGMFDVLAQEPASGEEGDVRNDAKLRIQEIWQAI